MARRRRRQAAPRQVVRRQKVNREVREARPRRQFQRLTKNSLQPIVAYAGPQSGVETVRRVTTRNASRNVSNVTVHLPADGRSFQFGALQSAVSSERPKPRKSVCASRKERREVIFAMSLRGKGSASQRRVFTEQSKERC